MASNTKSYKCPLCRSVLSKQKYLSIIGVWEERKKLEKTLNEQKNALKKEKSKLQAEMKALKQNMKKDMKRIEKTAFEKGKKKEKSRSDSLAKMIQNKTTKLREMNRKIKELEEQLKKGTTPQVEGLNLEDEIMKQLKKEFPTDQIDHPGKVGDILHHIVFKRKQIGLVLYECKKTAKFSNSYIDQTKKAVAKRKASYGVLITTAFKKKTAGFWVEKDIFIVHPYGAIYVAKVLRTSIVDMYSLRISGAELQKRSKELMSYMKSDDFKNNVADSIYRTKTLYDMLRKEVKTHRNIWVNRYKHYEAIHSNVHRLGFVTANIIKGLSAKQAIKQMKLEELPPPDEWE